MPQQPSRRDALGPPPRDVSDLANVVRQQQFYLRGLDTGFLDGRFATPKPVRPGPSPLVGGEAGGDAAAYEWQWEDRHVVTATGTQTPTLTYEPVEESLFVRWHPAGGAGVPITNEHFVLDEQRLTIPDPGFLAVGDEFSFQYQFDPGVSDVTEASLYDAAVLAEPTLLGFWRLAESSGLTMVDSSGHGHHGTYSPDIQLGQAPILSNDPDTTAHFRNLLEPRGVVPYGPWMNVPTLTVEAWVETDVSSSGIQYIVDRDTNARSWLMRIDTGGNLRYDNLASGGTAIAASSNVDDTNRHYCVSTYDGAHIRLYIDGALVETVAATGDPSTTADLAVGGTYAGDVTWWPTFYFRGRMSKVAFYSGAQSVAKILNRWQIGIGA